MQICSSTRFGPLRPGPTRLDYLISWYSPCRLLSWIRKNELRLPYEFEKISLRRHISKQSWPFPINADHQLVRPDSRVMVTLSRTCCGCITVYHDFLNHGRSWRKIVTVWLLGFSQWRTKSESRRMNNNRFAMVSLSKVFESKIVFKNLQKCFFYVSK